MTFICIERRVIKASAHKASLCNVHSIQSCSAISDCSSILIPIFIGTPSGQKPITDDLELHVTRQLQINGLDIHLDF